MVEGARADDGVTGTIAQLVDSGDWEGVQGAIAMCKGLGGLGVWSSSSWAVVVYAISIESQDVYGKVAGRQTLLQVGEQLSEQVLRHDADVGLDMVVED